MDVKKSIRNGLMNAGGLPRYSSNAPHNEDTVKQYFAGETKAFFLKQIRWASNNVTAMAQGLDPKDFYAWTKCSVRTSNLIHPTTGQPLESDWQRILINEGNVDYIPRGAKIAFNGNVYLVTNPGNVQSVLGTAVVRRCNAAWRRYDWYGNVMEEPFCFGQGTWDLATGNASSDYSITMNAYQHAIMQLGPDTADLAHNTRVLLGGKAYAVRGLVNFIRETSTEADSCHIQYFDFNQTEPLSANDDLASGVADGKAFSWTLNVSGDAEMQQGGTQTLTATSRRCGQIVTDGAEGHKITYLWESSDAGVAEVVPDGTVTAKGAGECEIYCILKQNPEIRGAWALTVAEAPAGNALAWKIHPPESVRRYATATFAAQAMTDGQEVAGDVLYTFSGPDESCYTAEVTGGAAKLTVWMSSDVPLHVTASWQGEALQTDITLEGY